MLRKIVFGAAALAVLGVASVAAQPAPDQGGTSRPSVSNDGRGQRPAVSREDATAFLDARIAALHAGLQLTPDQERLWPAVEKAYRDYAGLRIERRFAAPAAGQQQNQDPIARLRQRADFLTREGAALKTLADAAAPLWQTLDDNQKRRLVLMSRAVREIARDRRGDRDGFGRREDDRSGYGRDGDRFRFGPRAFGPDGRDGDRYGRDGDRFGYGPRGFGPDRRDGDRFGYGRDGDRFGYGPRGFGPGGRDGDDFGRDRGFDRDYGRDLFRGPRGRRGPDGGFRDDRSSNDRDLGAGAPDTDGRGGRAVPDDEDRL